VRERVVGELFGRDVGGGLGCNDGLYRSGGSTAVGAAHWGLCPFGARITRKGAHGEIPRSFANSAISQALIPSLLCAFAISSEIRVWRASLTDLSTLRGMVVTPGAIGRPEGSPECGLVGPRMRPERVVALRALAPATLHFGVQKRRTLPPLSTGGAGKAVWQWSQVRVWAAAIGAGLLLPIGPVVSRSVDFR
jgi:hypothetical protein